MARSAREVVVNVTASGIRRAVCFSLLVAAVSLLSVRSTEAARLDEMSLDRWAKLREAERFQLNVAEKYYRERNYKVALNEYEKFLTLYETSEGAAYSQLKWSLCLVQLKKLNTAISDGFRSVVDYWPESPEATSAAFYIGRTYKNMGETRKAKKAYQEVLEKHPKHLVAIYSLTDMADLASITRDIDDQVEAWKKLTFGFERNKDNATYCQNASRSLASHRFRNVKFTEGVESLATTYTELNLPPNVASYSRGQVEFLTRGDENRAKGLKLADQTVAWIRQQAPTGNEEAQVNLAISYWYLMADVHSASRRPNKVLETYAESLKKFGAKDETYRRIAEFYKGQDNYDKARAEFAKFENKIEGNSQIGYSYRQQSNFDLAVVSYRRNLNLDQENLVKWSGIIGDTLRDGRKFPEALATYTGLIQTDTANSQTWLWRIADMYQRYAGDYKQAIGYYRQCTNFPTNYQRMAECHIALKQHKEAIILYGQIMGGATKTAPWALLQIGYTHEKAGAKEKAIQSFQQVCKRFPKDGHASTAHAYLQDKYKITVTLGGAKTE